MSGSKETQARVTGFVVGFDRGTGWKVRVKQEGHPDDGRKFVVHSTAAPLEKGLEVTFLLGQFFSPDQRKFTQAYNVTLMPAQAESTEEKVSAAPVRKPEEVKMNTINLYAIESDGGRRLFITNAESLEDVQAELDATGSEDQVLDFLSFPIDGEPALGILQILGFTDDVQEGLEKFLTVVYLMGRNSN